TTAKDVEVKRPGSTHWAWLRYGYKGMGFFWTPTSAGPYKLRSRLRRPCEQHDLPVLADLNDVGQLTAARPASSAAAARSTGHVATVRSVTTQVSMAMMPVFRDPRAERLIPSHVW